MGRFSLFIEQNRTVFALVNKGKSILRHEKPLAYINICETEKSPSKRLLDLYKTIL